MDVFQDIKTSPIYGVRETVVIYEEKVLLFF